VEQHGEQVTAALGLVPEMMVRVDDRQRRLERGFARPLPEPRPQFRIIAPGEPAIFAFGVPSHDIPLFGGRPRRSSTALEGWDHFFRKTVEVLELYVERSAERGRADDAIEPGIARLNRL